MKGADKAAFPRAVGSDFGLTKREFIASQVAGPILAAVIHDQLKTHEPRVSMSKETLEWLSDAAATVSLAVADKILEDASK